MTNEANVQRAVELLRDLSKRTGNLGYVTVAMDINDIIAILSPPPLSKGERIARELEKIANNYYSATNAAPALLNIIAILREGDAK